MDKWDRYVKSFKTYLKLEKGLSQNTTEAYLRDVNKLREVFIDKDASQIHLDDLREFTKNLVKVGLEASSQARILSGIKTFYQFLLLEEHIQEDPTLLLDMPKSYRKIPEVLSVEEINKVLLKIDLSAPEGIRNRAILEVLYSCGLRVSELIDIKKSQCYFEDGFIQVTGKGEKSRLVPIGTQAIKFCKMYWDEIRCKNTIQKGNEDHLFLNNRGTALSRVMIFYIIKNCVYHAGIGKKVSPHSFRHSFASHLIEGGADLRAVQEMLGHSSITTTEIYTHLDRRFLQETIDKYHPRSRVTT